MKTFILLTLTCSMAIVTNAQQSISKSVLNKMNESYIALVFVNDCNIYLGPSPCKSNDTWYTLGMKLETAIRLPRQNLFVKAYGSTDLYTERIADREDHLGPLKQEIFTEINQLGFKIRPLIPKDNVFPEFGISAGIVNRDHAIRAMALALQSGLDGAGGYHKLVNQDPKSNVSRNDFIKYLTLSPQINKIVVIYNSERRPIWINFSLFADLSTYRPLSTLNHSIEVSIPLLARKNFAKAQVDLVASEKTQFHSMGVAFTPAIDLAASLFDRFQVTASTQFPFGAANNYNLTQVKADPQLEPLMNLKLKWKFFSSNK